MRQPKWALLVVLIVSIMTVGNWVYHGQVVKRLDKYSRSLQETKMTSLTSTWTSGGIARHVTSNRRDDEELDAFIQRHKQEVAAALIVFPKD